MTSTTAEKSFAIGTLAEVRKTNSKYARPCGDIISICQILKGLGDHARLLVSLFPTFVTFSKADQDDEVCSNSIYGLGMLASKALPEMQG